MSDPLDRYNAKRDFAKTREPAGEAGTAAGNGFMVQKHDASRLHWDFRLELSGVLKSWAVTRGPSLNPEDKRLAVRTEDHPLAYATFEGTIPQGEYGGGTVMLWDRGTWTPHPGKDPVKTLEEGHLHFTLHGERMKGAWIMIRLKPRGREKSENWLLRKVADDFAGGSDDLVERELTSVVTGRTMLEIAGGRAVLKPPARRGVAANEATATKPPVRGTKAGAKPTKAAPRARRTKYPLPAFRPPQLATLVDHVPAGSGWLHEVKYDGYRCLLAVAGGEARAYTRTGLDWSDRFAPIVAAARGLGIGSALIDGEVVALDDAGRPRFQTLQAALKEGSHPLVFFAFDLLEQDGEDLAALPTLARKARLAALLADAVEPIRYAEHVTGEGERLLAALCGEGYEGVVSKRADAPYRGRRTQGWLKTKCIRRQEFVIVGWTPSTKGRGFASLLLGLHEDGGLRYAGKVGTGFDADGIDALLAKLAPLERTEATVAAPRAMVKGARWVKPVLVAEVAFAEMTVANGLEGGVLRHSSFVALREDKPAGEVVREDAAPPRKRSVAEADAAPFGIAISSRDRVIFPESGLTKGALADYYAAVAGPMLAWAADRPVSLVRCPQGRARQCFFQKHDAGSFGDTVKQVPIRDRGGHDEPYLYVEDAAGLLACVQMGTIEFHGWGSRVAAVERVDRMVFDLDPDEGLGFPAVKDAALLLREVLADMGLASFPMLSGGKGVHVVVPLDATVSEGADWATVKDFASRFARAMAQAHADLFTASMKKAARKGRIFLDWLRNQRGATAVLPYSARARADAPVAAPVTWEELAGIETAARYTIRDAAMLVKRAASKDLKGWGRAAQGLPQV